MGNFGERLWGISASAINEPDARVAVLPEAGGNAAGESLVGSQPLVS